jgi:hypothetical protein
MTKDSSRVEHLVARPSSPALAKSASSSHVSPTRQIPSRTAMVAGMTCCKLYTKMRRESKHNKNRRDTVTCLFSQDGFDFLCHLKILWIGHTMCNNGGLECNYGFSIGQRLLNPWLDLKSQRGKPSLLIRSRPETATYSPHGDDVFA